MSAVADTEEKILNAAAQLFAERGYGGTTTRCIAEKAGVNEVTLFRRFENKQGVLKALGERFAAAAASRTVQALPNPEDVEATLFALASNEIRSSVENGGVALRLAFDARSIPEVAELIGEGPKSNLEALADYFADRQRAGAVRKDVDPVVLAEAFATLTSSYVMFRLVMGLLDEREEVGSEMSIRQLVSVFLDGARNKQG